MRSETYQHQALDQFGNHWQIWNCSVVCWIRAIQSRFFSNDEACAILKPRGKHSSNNNKLTILATTGAYTSAQCFNNETRKISCSDDFKGILLMSCSTSSSETEPKLFRIGPVWTRCWPNMTDPAVVNIRAIMFLMCNSFIWKKSLMVSASSLVLQPRFTSFLSSCRRSFKISHVCFGYDVTSDKRVFKCAVRESVTACYSIIIILFSLFTYYICFIFYCLWFGGNNSQILQYQ